MRISEKTFWYTLYLVSLFVIPYIIWKIITLSGGLAEYYIGYIMIAGWVVFWPLLGWGMYQDLNEK